MQFNIGLIKSPNQFLLTSYELGKESSSKLLELADLPKSELQALIYNEDFSENEEFKSIIQEESKFYPLTSMQEINSNFETLEKMPYDDAKLVFGKIHNRWLLGNNISLLEELFSVIHHLDELWPNDRTTFFEELWFILKKNLGAKSLRVIFNDIAISKKETEKNKLIRVKIEGHKNPTPVLGGELEDKIMKSYELDFNSHFEVVEYAQQTGKMVIAASLKKSPVIIMAEVYELSRLQKAVVSALINGLTVKK